MLHMMDREAGDDSIELAQVGKWMIEVVGNDGNGRITGKSLCGGVEHGRRKVNGDGLGVGMLAFDQRQQSSISGAEIENAARGWGNELEQGRFALGAMLDGVGPFEVVEGVIGLSPEIDGHATV